jgi:PAS domain S-box-containing protein
MEGAFMMSIEYLEAIIDCIGDPVFVKDQQYKFVFINDAACEMFGISREMLLGKTDYELFPREQADVFRMHDARVFETGEKDVSEEQIADVQGNVRTIVTKKTLCINRAGEKHLVGVMWDITERKRAEGALQAAHRQLMDIIEFLPDAILVIDLEKRVIAWNKAMEEMTGVKKEDMLGKGDYAYAVPFYGEPRPLTIDLVLEWDTEMVRQYDFVKQEGDALLTASYVPMICGGKGAYLSGKASPLFDAEGHVIGAIESIRDITEQRQTEEALRESEEKFRRLADNAGLGIYLIQDDQFRYVNRKFADIFGYRVDEIVDKMGPSDLTTPEDAALVASNVSKRLSGEADFVSYEFRARTRNNGVIIVEIHGSRTTCQGRPAVIGTLQDITGRKRDEEALRESEAFNRRLFESNRTAIVVTDAETNRYVDCNPAAVAIYRYHSRDELIGKTPFDVSADIQYDGTPSSEKVVNYIKEARDNGFVTFEWLHRRPDGQYWDALVHLMSFESRGHRLIQFSLYDITEQKKTEEALKQAEAKYRAIFENAGMGIYQTSIQGHVTIANPALGRICGYDSPQDLMNSINDIGGEVYVNPYDRARIGELCLKHGLVEGFETQLYRKDKSTVWVSINARALKDMEGNIMYFEGAMEDITVRKRAEDALRGSEQRFRSLVETTSDWVWEVDENAVYTYASPKIKDILGYEPEEVIGKRPFDLMDRHEAERVAAIFGDIAKFRKSFSGLENTNISKEGQKVVLETSGVPIFDNNGRFSGYRGIDRNVTERKHLESKLHHSEKMQAVGTLAGGIAHDFNNILTALIGYAALLRMKITDGNLHAYVDQILSASQKATDLVQSLLAFSRQQPISPGPISIHGIIEGTEKLLKRLVTEDITIKTLLAAEDIMIMADRTQIDQILFNLATNARDAMPQGGTVVIETKAVELDDEFRRLHGYGEPGRYALLSISDTGVGMDRATRERIFDPFFTTKEVGKGTGLGLSTVYGIVKQHNGYINVYSEPKKGTTFHIYLPAVNKIGEEDRSAQAPAGRGSETILVAEDSEELRRLISTILIEYGYTTVEAIDGAEAVEQFKKADQIDLLILDSVMPKKNGREAYDEIIKIKQDIRVIFTSGYTRDVFLDKGIEDKKFNFLQKPIAPNALLRKVREVLDQGRTAR